MRLLVLITIGFIPLIASSPVQLGDGFSLPTLENIESHIDNLWSNFKKGYGIVYNSTVEEVHRFKIFATHVKLIIQHNIEHDLGLHTYRLGINKYATLTNEEFRHQLNGYKRQKLHRAQYSDIRRQHIPASPYVTLPVSVDWRDQGIVTPVKDQGQCGSCWAFSSTGALEGHHARSTGKLVSLSEQQLVDCSTNWGNNGCNGGLMDNAFKYVHDNKGIDDETTYPYVGKDEAACKFRRKSVASTCDSFVDIPAGNETALQEALAIEGPVAVAIDASRSTFQFYTSGVYSDPQCSSEELDHGVLAVGYGVASDPVKGQQEYYIVKNSWSAAWGDKGYIKMARNKNNMCGISTAASYPVVKDKSLADADTLDY
jgi:cathepsin L